MLKELGKFNIKPLKYRRRKLREDSTDAEKILWEKLRNKQTGFRFVRQFSVDNYVIDYYCPEIRLGIELEGGIHKKPFQIKYDKYREEYIKAFGIKIMKFKNEEVEESADKVVNKIFFELTPLIPLS